jgi:hypothetical protein
MGPHIGESFGIDLDAPDMPCACGMQGRAHAHDTKEARMSVKRREFLHLAAGGVVAGALRAPLKAQAAPRPQYKAIAFDAFPIFDPRPVFGLAERFFQGGEQR